MIAEPLSTAQVEINSINARIDRLSAELRRPGGGDKSHVREQIRRAKAQREAIGKAALLQYAADLAAAGGVR